MKNRIKNFEFFVGKKIKEAESVGRYYGRKQYAMKASHAIGVEKDLNET